MRGVNRHEIIGFIGRLGELRTTSGGNSVFSFSVATSEYQGKGKEEHTEWHNIVCWGKTAEFAAQYLEKGGLVRVVGAVRKKSWEDKEGLKKFSQETLANEVMPLGRAKYSPKNKPDNDAEDSDNDGPTLFG